MLKSRSGKYNSVNEEQLAYESLSPSGQERFYSTSTIREKCDQCDLEDRCCEVNCPVFEDKINMDLDNPCNYCIYDSEVCYAANEIDLESDYRPSIRDFKIRTNDDKVWSYDEIDQLQDKEMKLLLGLRFINKYFKAIGRGDLLFKYRQSKGIYHVEFIGLKYNLSSHISAFEVLEKAWPYAT